MQDSQSLYTVIKSLTFDTVGISFPFDTAGTSDVVACDFPRPLLTHL